MRILICAQESYEGPPNGFKTQIATVVRTLDTAHDVRVLALATPGQSIVEGNGGMRLVQTETLLRRNGRSASPRPTPWAAPYSYAPLVAALQQPLIEELDSFQPDLVYVTGVRLAALGRQLGDRPCIVAPLDAAHLSLHAQAIAAKGVARQLLHAASRRVRRFEAEEYARFDRVLVLGDIDRHALVTANPDLPVQVIPHSVDSVRFAPRPDIQPNRYRIVFAGVMSAAANRTAVSFLAHQVIPRVRAKIPEAHLAVVGRTPPRSVRALGRLDGVTVVGEVADMPAALAASRACAAPMLTGSGVKNKLLEAMACGLPCVTTALGLNGLQATPGRELLVAETADEFAGRLVQLLTYDEYAMKTGAAGREYIRAWHGSRMVASALERICGEIVRRQPTNKCLIKGP